VVYLTAAVVVVGVVCVLDLLVNGAGSRVGTFMSPGCSACVEPAFALVGDGGVVAVSGDLDEVAAAATAAA